MGWMEVDGVGRMEAQLPGSVKGQVTARKDLSLSEAHPTRGGAGRWPLLPP